MAVETKRHGPREQEQAVARQRRLVMLGAAVVVVILVGLVAARLLRAGGGAAEASDAPAPDSLVAQVTSVPPATLEAVGRGDVAAMPVAVRTDVQRDSNGLSLVTYVGAEYCPFCAAERWPLTIALSRFGTFSNLWLSHSASDDVFPNTPTLSFAHASYTSQYVSFQPVELTTNVRSGSSYQPLQTPTPAQNSLLQQYDGPPYVPASGAGSIPFIDFAGQYIVAGASFDAGVLRGMTQNQVAAAL